LASAISSVSETLSQSREGQELRRAASTTIIQKFTSYFIGRVEIMTQNSPFLDKNHFDTGSDKSDICFDHQTMKISVLETVTEENSDTIPASYQRVYPPITPAPPLHRADPLTPEMIEELDQLLFELREEDSKNQGVDDKDEK